MTIHLVKLCVGAQSIDDLASWQAGRLAGQSGGDGGHKRLFHTTHQTPKRTQDLLDGGSIYWVIKGVIQVRQRLVGFDEGAKNDGKRCCLLLLDPKLVPVRPTPRRAFQGWRYLDDDDAPDDLTGPSGSQVTQMPPRMRRELAELGLI
ncbi:MAG: DUF1489 domain-containing protein [Alphaproteobacteria bacterium]|nr:DUF1489 domain-containing protein [Alphaproteobacteria bacterium]